MYCVYFYLKHIAFLKTWPSTLIQWIIVSNFYRCQSILTIIVHQPLSRSYSPKSVCHNKLHTTSLRGIVSRAFFFLQGSYQKTCGKYLTVLAGRITSILIVSCYELGFNFHLICNKVASVDFETESN